MSDSFADPTLLRWCFFRQQQGHGSRAQRAQSDPHYSRDKFADEFWESVEAQAEAIGQTVTPPADHEFYSSADAELAKPDPTTNAGLTRELIAFGVADSYCLLLGIEREGNFNNFDALKPLQPPSKLGASPPFFIGEVAALVAGIAPNLSTQEKLNLLHQLACSWLGEPLPAPRGVFASGPFLLWALPTKAGLTLIFLYDTDAPQSDVYDLAYIVLPPLALIYLKWHQIKAEYLANLLRNAEAAEQSLELALAAASIERLRVRDMEGHSGAIAQSQMKLERALSDIESRLQTLKINAKNLELLRSDARWLSAQPAATSSDSLPLTREIALLIEQIEADLHYLRLTATEASGKLQYLETVTGIHSAQNERLIACVLGAFTGVGVGQLVPEFPWGTPEPAGAPEDLWWRVALTLLGAVAFLGLYVYGRLRKVKIGGAT